MPRVNHATTKPITRMICAALLLLAFIAPAHAQRGNSTNIGMNLGGIVDWETAWTFTDVFKHSRSWIPQHVEPDGVWDTQERIETTPEGWVARLKPNQAAATLMCTDSNGVWPSGTYTVLYEGEGTLEFPWNNATVRSFEPGKITLSVDLSGDTALFLRLTRTDPSDPVRNIRVLMPGFAETYEKNLFHPDFLDSVRPFAFVRFMDWQRTNEAEHRNPAWSARTTPASRSQALGTGVCPEYMIELCNTLKKDAWFCMPHTADDAYIKSFAELVHDKLDPSLSVYIEHSNEVWNGSFSQHHHAREQGLKLGLSDNDYQAALRYHSRRSVEIFRIWEGVYKGDERDRLIRVLAGHSANTWATEQIIGFEDAYKHADAFAIGPYFGYEFGTPERGDETAEMSPAKLLRALPLSVDNTMNDVRKHMELCKARGLDLIAYEGGQHLAGVGPQADNEKLTQLYLATNRHQGMQRVYRDYLRDWNEITGNAPFAAFSHIGRYSKWGSWGAKEFQNQPDSEAPKWRALTD